MALEPEERYGIVYFIGHANSGPVKTGFTADRDPTVRLRQLQTGSPEELGILGMIKGYLCVEQNIQAFLGFHCVRGEWFERNAALAVLERLQKQERFHQSEFVDRLRTIKLIDSSGDEDDEDPLQLHVARCLLWDIAHQLTTVNTASSLPFRAWLLAQAERDHPTGDLARDVQSDNEFPSIGSLTDYLDYLKEKASSSAVIRAVIEAWIECDNAVVRLTFRKEDVSNSPST